MNHKGKKDIQFILQDCKSFILIKVYQELENGGKKILMPINYSLFDTNDFYILKDMVIRCDEKELEEVSNGTLHYYGKKTTKELSQEFASMEFSCAISNQVDSFELRLKHLNTALNRCVEEEEYLLAAKIRDQINEMKRMMV